MGHQAADDRRQDHEHCGARRAEAEGLTTSSTPTLAAPGPVTGVRARRVRVSGWLGGGVLAGAAVGWLHHTGGYAVAPGGLLTCPLHASTGLFCPFCGGLRCVAAVSHGDVVGAASLNVMVLVLLPMLAVWWAVGLRAAAIGRPHPWPRMSNRGWLVLGAVLLLFTVWRNLPALPLAEFLAP